MKSVFQEYKTPTMSECAMLGQEVGLQKRVVQVRHKDTSRIHWKPYIKKPFVPEEIYFIWVFI